MTLPPGRLVLVIDRYIVTPDRDAGSVRLDALLDLLAGHGLGVVVAPASRAAPERYAQRLEGRGIAVVEGAGGVERVLQDERDRLAAVVLCRHVVADRYLPHVRALAPGVPVIYDTVDLMWMRQQRQADLVGSRAIARWAEHTQARDRELVADADATVAITDEEAAVLRREVPDARVVVVPMIHDAPTEPAAEPPPDPSALFVGNFRHNPNVDAVEWFVAEVLPRVRAAAPRFRLRVAGAAPPPGLVARADDSLEVLGWVEDLAPLYARSRVAVAPLRYGAGMKGKIGEALSHGVPVVTTTVGAEGFAGAGDDRSPIAVADTATAFADAVLRLLDDDGAWRTASVAAREFAAGNLSRLAVADRVDEMLRAAGVTA